MRRIVMAIASALALALAVPGMALAAHRHHHGHTGRHHKSRHAKGARLIRFAPAEEGKGGTTSSGSSTSTQSSTTTEGSTEPETVGTISSFENEVLTIKLSDGSLVSGKVTEDTRIVCISSTPSQPDDDEGSGDDQSSEGEDHHGDEGEGSSRQGEGDEGQQEGEQGGWQSAHDSSFDGEGDGSTSGCEKSALVAGAAVHEAELRLTSAGATWESVVLVS